MSNFKKSSNKQLQQERQLARLQEASAQLQGIADESCAKPDLEVPQQLQALEQNDAAPQLREQRSTFRNRPVLDLRIQVEDGNGTKKT